jgi:acylphosphatase
LGLDNQDLVLWGHPAVAQEISVYLCIEGTVAADSYLDWIVERANRLSLRGDVRRISAKRIDVNVRGPEPLVDAMELAVSLGPAEILVDRIERKFLHARIDSNDFCRVR